MNDFHTASDLLLNKAADFFESSWPGADVDMLDDTLTIILPGGEQYVINKHGVTQQIWVSSPFTGAHHFAYQEGMWTCTRTHIELEDLLLDERNTYAT
ncbi:MAG: iron donor protein CyaY [Proteobacteria bacterium]|nr:iron donor protein CyaY [Pseudomonadota bacterium]